LHYQLSTTDFEGTKTTASVNVVNASRLSTQEEEAIRYGPVCSVL